MESYIFASMRYVVFSIFLMAIWGSSQAQQFLTPLPQAVKHPKSPAFLTPGFQLKGLFKDDFLDAFDQGNSLLSEEEYSAALGQFLYAYNLDPTSANINYLTGLTILKSLAIKDKSKAIRLLERASHDMTKHYNEFETEERKAPIATLYYLAYAYHLSYRFDEAIATMQLFKEKVGASQSFEAKDADRIIGWSNTAKKLIQSPVGGTIVNLGDSINSPFPDYSAVLSADEHTLIFSSRRTGNVDDLIHDGKTNEFVYISYKDKNGLWSKAKPMGDSVITPYNEASVSLSADGQELAVYQEVNGGDLFLSHLIGNIWSKPRPIGQGSEHSDINTAAWETSASFSADGQIIYFVSDRKGGHGGRDIWQCKKLPNGKWSMASNLGLPINSQYDEEAPFIDASGKTMYFSSTRPESMGGFDIFVSELQEDGHWSEPKNIGYPINTTGDDVFFVTSPDGQRAYFSSVRKEGFGDKDIYMLKVENPGEKPLALIKGYISLPNGGELPNGITIEAAGADNGQLMGIYRPLKRDGSYVIILPVNASYNLSFKQNGQEFYAERIAVPENGSYQEIKRDLTLQPVDNH